MAMMMSTEVHEGLAKTVEEARGQLVLANQILSNENLLDGLGHVSVRHPKDANVFLQSRSLSPELVTEADILEIDLDGKVITKTDMKPYGERIIHAAIFKARPDVLAVFHGHPHSVIPFSVTGVPTRPVAHFGSMFYQGTPLYDDYDVSSGTEEGERIARVMGQARALLMRGHGCVVVGESVPAMVMASILRDNAAIQLQALSLGQPRYLTNEEGRQANRIMASQVPLERLWTYWVGRARKVSTSG
jgi:3-hydroxy-2-methylpyridine-4,5-dicarboxylate 4-decarboxylase